jgi:hypothetical protein
MLAGISKRIITESKRIIMAADGLRPPAKQERDSSSPDDHLYQTQGSMLSRLASELPSTG